MRDLDALADRCLMPGFVGLEPPGWVLRRAPNLGGVCLYARNVETAEQLATLNRRLHEENPGLVIGIDEEGGDVTRLEARTGSSYPGSLALGQVDDADLTRRIAASMGAELSAAGVDVDLAPDADVNSNPANPVIGVRAFGSTPELVSRQVVAFVEGLQGAGVAACVKHFPGHGATSLDSHLALPVVDEDPHDGALDPFRAAVTAGVKAVMSAHIVVTALDSVPATISPRVMTGLLRQELGFDGLVITDGLEMRAIGDGVGIAQGAVAALAAGCDLLCIGGGLADEQIVDELHQAIVDAVRTGRLPESRLIDAAQRIDALAAWRAAQAEAASPHRELGLEAARRAVTAENLEPIGDDVAVMRLSSTPSQAAGVVPWGVATPLAGLGLRVTAVDVDHEPADADELVARTGGRNLVLAVRNLHRHPWQRATVEAMLVRRPEAVLVEMGLPACRPNGSRAYVATHGAARVCGVAAAEVLTGLRA